MANIFLKIYDFLEAHRKLFWLFLILFVVLLGLSAATLRYSEDIFDFMPLDPKSRDAMNIYQDLTHGNEIILLFESSEALDSVVYALKNGEGENHIKDIVWQIDFDRMLDVPGFIYKNIPLMLSESDYKSMDETINEPGYVHEKMNDNLMSLSMGLPYNSGENIANDPLSIFSPIFERLNDWIGEMTMIVDDGYIYTKDHKYAMALIESPYGSVESANNTELVEYVEKTTENVMKRLPPTEWIMVGAPVIAVENAKQIKRDSIVAITVSMLLITLLLYLAFRNFRSIILIVITILFGWLFAMALIRLSTQNVSILVLGIGCTIIGIAVNYPLHYIAHGNKNKSPREVLKEIVLPLLIGNITTVGAFACLIPLDAPALRDLGFFAGSMLIGTIVFVLIFLPHFSKRVFSYNDERLLFARIAYKSPKSNPWVLIAIVVATCVLGYFSLDTKFDANIQNVNYLSEDQQRILDRFDFLAGPNDSTKVFLVGTGDSWEDALNSGANFPVASFVPSEREQENRIRLWRKFVKKNMPILIDSIRNNANRLGFSDDAFDDFFEIVRNDYSPQPFEVFSPLTSTFFVNSFSQSNGKYSVISIVDVSREEKKCLEHDINQGEDKSLYAFDFENLNKDIVNNLSDNFNYIGFASGFIVFMFLWFSFGKLSYAMLAFLPMVIGWIWILGIMSLLGVEFNIVNVILASFIFGQGDDYTIFIVEGLISEKLYNRKVLPSYRNSIIISALIMFIGIGSLIFSKHPALHSLAEVTIIGMAVVVLMSWVLPPLLFPILVRETHITYKNGK